MDSTSAFFFDHTAFEEASGQEELPSFTPPTHWVPDPPFMERVNSRRCPFCETDLNRECWFSDSDSQYYDERTNESSMCNRCGFWTYATVLSAEGICRSEIVTSRLVRFDVSDLAAPTCAIADWVASHRPDVYCVHPRSLEKIVQSVLSEFLACDLDLTRTSRDGGFDLFGFNSERGKFVVEVKRYGRKRPVGVSVVRQVAGVVLRENAGMGLIVSTSGFSKDARREATQLGSTEQHHPVALALLDVGDLLDWWGARDTRLRYPSGEQYWKGHLRTILGHRFFSWDEWREGREGEQERIRDLTNRRLTPHAPDGAWRP